MNLQLALIPNKHVRIDQSVLGLAGYCLSLLESPKSPDELYSILNSNNSNWNFKPTLDHIILALDTLYSIGKIKTTTDNRLKVIP